MLSFPVPAFVGTDCRKVVAVHCHAAPRQSLSQLPFRFHRHTAGNPFRLLLPHGQPAVQIFQHLRVQGQVHSLPAIQHFQRHFAVIIVLDYPVDDFQPFFRRSFFQCVGGQCGKFLLCQVILQVRIHRSRLHGQRSCLAIHDNTVACQAFLPSLVGEIHRRGYQFLVGLGRLGASLSGVYGRHHALQFFQHIPLRYRGGGVSFVIEAVAARL